MYIGYAYFGGMTLWNTAFGHFPSYSPVKLSSAKSYWALGADTNFKVGTRWSGQVSAGGQYEFEYGKVPPHPVRGGAPAGGNEVFADGSARWCKFDTMYRFNRYASAIGDLDCYWFQETTDFDQTLLHRLRQLK